MKKTIITTLIAISVFTTTSVFASTANSMMIMDAWVRAAPPSAQVQAAFFTVMNHSNEPIVITDVEAQGFGRSELHLSSKKNNMMTMQKQQQITIPANATFQFKPGGYHVMLLEPSNIAVPGDLVTLSFTLLSGETLTAKLPVKRDNNKMPIDHHSKMVHATMKHD